MEKIVTSRKVYICDHCEKEIDIGERYVFGKGRNPSYDEDGHQDGIKYYQYRLCLKCNNNYYKTTLDE